MFVIKEKHIDKLREEMTDRRFIDYCVNRLDRSSEEIEKKVTSALSEMLIGLELLKDIDLSGKRILEIGCGIGLVSLILRQYEMDIMSIEPTQSGFDLTVEIGSCFREWRGIDNFVINLGAEELQVEKHGSFDIIFSVNVLEHISDLENAVAAMCRVLKPDGLMRHTCPNYTVPYEPHFGFLLIPFVPRLTTYFILKDYDTDLWNSLNFVTLHRLNRAFRKNGLLCNFDRSTMYLAFMRLEQDKDFSSRHGKHFLVSFTNTILRKFGLLRLLKLLPPALSSPMTFTTRKKVGRVRDSFCVESSF